MADIFISYASEDRERVAPLASMLRDSGWSVFWDREIPAGQTWRSYIGSALAEARCVVVAWSHASVSSEWVGEEAEEAKKRGVLVPVLLDRVDQPLGFRSIQAADLTSWRPGRPSPAFDRLCDDLARFVGASHAAKAPPTPLHAQPPGSVARKVVYAALAAIVMVGGYVGYRSITDGTPGSGSRPQMTSPATSDTSRASRSASEAPAPDFPGGSREVYSADFAAWSMGSNDNGTLSLGFGNSFVMEPSANRWLGPGASPVSPPLEADFVLDLHFRIEERSPSSSLNLTLGGGGDDAEVVDAYLSVWSDTNVTYTLTKGRRRSGGGLQVPHVVTEATLADREQLPAAAKDHDWSTGGTLSLKRVGGSCQLFVNGSFVTEFAVSRFAVSSASVAAAWDSRVILTSLVARIPA